MSVSFLRSLTTAKVGLDSPLLESLALKGGGPVLRVYGFIKKTEAKAGDLGPYIVFNGEFEAVNLVAGTTFRAGRMMLPGIAEAALASEVGEGAALKFALELGVVENKSSKGGRKYMYTVKPLIDQQQDDELTKLAATLPDVKQIAAPAPANGGGKGKGGR